MAEREPAMLGDPDGQPTPDPVAADPPAAEPAADVPEPVAQERATDPEPAERPRVPRADKPARPERKPSPSRGDAVHVAGFWRRMLAACVDLAVIAPIAFLLTWIASKLGHVHLPASRMRGPDFWLDLVLHSDPALMTAFAMWLAVVTVYLMTFQLLLGQTVGMRLLRMRVIDVWGERPSIARCAARTVGYLVGMATVMLGFLWVGFDSEKRGLHDWIAGTYVIKA